MLNLMKPGHVLRFAVCPSTIPPPRGGPSAFNDNTRTDEWPTARKSLGNASLLTHPSGMLAPICGDIATKLRGVNSFKRNMSYSKAGNSARAVTKRRNVQLGAVVADFVGYTDGRSNYVQSANMVFSKDFSGCLMVAYTLNGQRFVAHAAASQVATMDCQQAFLTKIQGLGAQLIGWFRPFVANTDTNQKIAAFNVASKYIGGQINNLASFGAVFGGYGIAIDAFKPDGGPPGHWVITNVTPKTMSVSWVA